MVYFKAYRRSRVVGGHDLLFPLLVEEVARIWSKMYAMAASG